MYLCTFLFNSATYNDFTHANEACTKIYNTKYSKKPSKLGKYCAKAYTIIIDIALSYSLYDLLFYTELSHLYL